VSLSHADDVPVFDYLRAQRACLQVKVYRRVPGTRRVPRAPTRAAQAAA
jgi:hypothetical protein